MFSGPVVSAITGLLPDLYTVGASLLALTVLLYGFRIICEMIYRTHHGGLSSYDDPVGSVVETSEWSEGGSHYKYTSRSDAYLNASGDLVNEDGELF